jgi:DNA-binding NtrC family response regulator
MKVLITLQDVEPAVRLNARLEQSGVDTTVVSPLDDIRGEIKRFKPDVVVLTADLADKQNLALVNELLWDARVVVGLAEGADLSLRESLRALGYTEVYGKPVDYEEVAESIRRLCERHALQRITGLYGESEAIREVLVKIEQMAPVSSTVLIEGESGTGKELVAHGIHLLSQRKTRPFIPVNVGALPETLLESELFGHEKGAFTGAAERRLGRFELADTGTLFLDEIGEVPLGTQVKLLRVLESREFLRLGGTSPIHVDVRVVAATNRPLRQHVEEGTFRTDLYYRLNVLNIYLPPLRERREDIPLLVRRFVREFSREHDRPFHGISSDAMEIMVGYPWPGNVRELRNLVESMVVLSPGRQVGPDDLPRHIREAGGARLLPVHMGPVVRTEREAEGRELEFILRSILELRLQVEELRRRLDDDNRLRPQDYIGEVRIPAGSVAVSPSPPAPHGAVAAIQPRSAPPPNVVTIEPGTRMADVERAVIEAALRETRGNRRRAAEMLGIGERTLYRKIKEYRLPESFVSADGAELHE